MPERDRNNNEKEEEYEEDRKWTTNSGRQRRRRRTVKRRHIHRYEDGYESYSESETDEEDDDRITGKCWGLIVQIILYIVNCILWIMAICAAAFALVIGLETDTISCSDPSLLDWTISTPATVFLFYSWPILAVATFGCFAIVSANFICLIIYIILLLLLIIFDIAFGISIMGSKYAYDNFILHLYNSIHHYGANRTRHVGILPINATKYWDHLQRRGKCCGLYSYMDWKNTSLARTTYSIPDSCCNKYYDYEGCGQLIWKHPDHELHTIESIIHDRGCLTIFPWFIQDDEEEHLHILGIFILIFIIIGIIGSIILFIFVITTFFRTPTGLNNPEFPDVPADPTLHTLRNEKVHPEDGPDSRGDRDDEGRYTERKISFDSGPTYIPERERSVTRRHSETVYVRRTSGTREEPSQPTYVRRSSGAKEEPIYVRRTSGPKEEPTQPTYVRRSSGPKEEPIYVRRSSGAREESLTRQTRKSSIHKEKSPPRQERRSSVQRERSPPRQVRRASVPRETSPPSHASSGPRRSSLSEDRERRASLQREKSPSSRQTKRASSIQRETSPRTIFSGGARRTSAADDKAAKQSLFYDFD